MSLLLTVLIADIALVLTGGIWTVKAMDQKARDSKRVTYRLNFPVDLSPDHVVTWLRSISGTLRGGRMHLTGLPTVAFEVFATNKGIVHRLKVPYGHEQFVVSKLRLAGINAVPEDEFEDRNWTRAVELGLKNSGRQLRIFEPGDVSAAILADLQALEPDQAVIMQWVVSPAAPRKLPVQGEALSSESNLRMLMNDGLASNDEVADRRKKMEEPNFIAVLRVASFAKTDSAARGLTERLRMSLGALRGPTVRFQRRLVSLPSLRERIREARGSVVFPMQLSAPELSAVIAWPMGNPFVAGLAPTMTRHMPAVASIPTDGRVLGTATFPGAEKPVAVAYKHTVRHTYVLGPSGCLHPDTPIFDPVDRSTRTVKQRYEEAEPFHVFALDGEQIVVAQAAAPARYRRVGMYEVYNDDNSFVVTGQHKVWNGQEYVEVQKLYGQQKSVPIRLPSASAADLLRLLGDAQHLKRTAASFQADHRPECRFCGVPLPEVSGSGQAFSPSQDGVDELCYSHPGVDGLEHTRGCSRQHRQLRHRARNSCPIHVEPDPASARPIDVDTSARTCGSRPSHSVSDSRSARPGSGASAQPSARRTIDYGLALSATGSQRAGNANVLTGSLLQSESLSQSRCIHERRAQEYLESSVGLEPSSNLLFKDYFSNSTFRVRPASAETYYDFHVPVYENYYACGVIHHNTGKTTLLANMMAQDMERGHGIILIEGKGDLFEEALERIPTSRINDVIVLDVNDSDRPVGFNILDQGNSRTSIDELSTLIATMYADASKSLHAPQVLYHMLHALAEVPGHTFIDLPVLLANHSSTDPNGDWQDWLIRSLKSKDIRLFMQRFMNMKQAERDRMAGPVYNRTWEFTSRPEIKNIMGQRTSSFKMVDAIRDNKIVLVNLNGTRVGQQTASIAGTLLVNAVWQAVRQVQARIPNFLYLDEFQDFTNLPVGVEAMLAKARSSNLGLVLAHQHTGQLKPETRGAAIANTGTKVIFQTTSDDARLISREFGSSVKDVDLLNLGRHEAIARIATDAGTSPPVTIATRPPGRSTGNASKVRAASRATYGRAREDVEREIEARPKATADKPKRRPRVSGEAWM